jgi:mycothiol system anti-sigma-R factor
MSCGDHHDTDCSEVIEAVYVYLDGEQTEADRHRIREHLDECSPCLRQFGIEQEVKALVARCCGGEVAPDGLRAKVLLRIKQVRVTSAALEYRAD